MPLFYANHSSTEFILAPTPNATLTVQLHYAYDPESITVASSGTSWLGTNAESALLYGSLIEAYIFMKGDADVLQMYETKYADAVSQLATLVDGRLKRERRMEMAQAAFNFLPTRAAMDIAGFEAEDIFAHS